MSYTLRPATAAVLRDLEDMQRHGRCQRFTLRYVEGRLYCSECRIDATSIEHLCDNQMTGVSGQSDIVSGGPGSLLTPRGRGRSRTPGVRR